MNNKPYKLIDEGIRSRLLQAIRLGSYIEHACFYAGIDSSTFRKWRQKAEKDIEPYKSFWKEVQLAESEAIMRRLARIEKVAEEGNWQADAWVLERKYPDKFGRRDRLSVNLDPNKPVEVNLEWSDGQALDREKEIVIDQEEE
ncbi:putative DNA binding protein [uncultured Mediterranean phage uvMED]|nr:putative DNA binding protein [uncultured Mediterranean phage uvMED]BAQ84842.1 putative DNA binding protein [uncultured Mediterranean phage uvMED]BAQ84929.1 putative DNA binding protein [uncultured Mediterranean phage uvMED]BAR13794.1 putative DNA binding protein [uncultured Mediterranean phage uvMED]BAR14847.1 putative DNA binding protein [uncultured Mediterranean phage uvMED]